MKNLLETLRALAEPTRIRLLRLLCQEELSVAELQEILGMGQSRVSAHLGQMRRLGLVEDRRAGRRIFYAARHPLSETVRSLLDAASLELPEVASDDAALDLALQKRKDKAAEYFNKLAGKFGRTYIPGRTWRGLSHALMELLPVCDVADLGAGEATVSMMFARRAKKVIAVDSSPAMVAYGQRLAAENDIQNIEFRQGDLESLPLSDGEVDIVWMSQVLHHVASPSRALREAWRVLRPGGRLLVLDLLSHDFEEARNLYAHVWLGFSEVEICQMLKRAGFLAVHARVAAVEKISPHFKTLLAVGDKPTVSKSP